jgi:dihydroorotate dehydrogenase (fumarate)
MDLNVRYLGLDLPTPFVVGASPLADDLDGARRLEDAGASALVMRSLFEEQIVREQVAAFLHTEMHGESFAEAMSYFPSPSRFVFGPEEYLDHLRRLKESLHIPVIASLNGASPGGWLDFPPLMEKMGADALEVNLYPLALDPEVPGAAVEETALLAVREVRRAVRIPVAVKLSPYYSSLAHFARRLEGEGADGIVLFNRFYQPDIDVQTLQVKESLELSSPAELPLRLRWVAALCGKLKGSLAVTGGVHNATDVVKSVMAGADAVQLVSVLLRHGPARLRGLRAELEQWMTEHEWTSLREMRGNMSLLRCPDPAVYERANYMMILQGWRGRPQAASAR